MAWMDTYPELLRGCARTIRILGFIGWVLVIGLVTYITVAVTGVAQVNGGSWPLFALAMYFLGIAILIAGYSLRSKANNAVPMLAVPAIAKRAIVIGWVSVASLFWGYFAASFVLQILQLLMK